jgi:hypothetical protein
MRWRDHVDRCVSVLETDRFAPGIPACIEARKACVTASGLVSRPPGVELLVPALRVCSAADADVGAPYGGVSISVHGHLLDYWRATIRGNVQLLYQPLDK